MHVTEHGDWHIVRFNKHYESFMKFIYIHIYKSVHSNLYPNLVTHISWFLKIYLIPALNREVSFKRSKIYN